MRYRRERNAGERKTQDTRIKLQQPVFAARKAASRDRAVNAGSTAQFGEHPLFVEHAGLRPEDHDTARFAEGLA